MRKRKPFLNQIIYVSCLIILLLYLLGEAICQIGIFKKSISYYVGSGAQAVAGGDLDGDKDIDLVTANLKSSELSIFLNNGNGTFSAGSEYAIQKGPLVMCTGDLDGDKDIDLAVLCFSAGKISVMLNNGKAGLRVSGSYDVPGVPIDMCLGDFNADGRLDIAAANSQSEELAVLINKGNGKFSLDARVPLPENTFHILCGDFNNDNNVDLVAGGGSKIYTLLNSRRSPNFSSYRGYNVGKGVQAIACGYFNSDKNLDLAVTNSAEELWVFFGKGDGTLQQQTIYKVNTLPNLLVTMDIDGDSKTDLITANKRTKDLSMFINRGERRFDYPIKYNLQKEVLAIYPADLDSNKKVDLAIVSAFGDLTILINTFGERLY